MSELDQVETKPERPPSSVNNLLQSFYEIDPTDHPLILELLQTFVDAWPRRSSGISSPVSSGDESNPAS